MSAAGDWSQVKVWYGPQGGLGTSTYPTNGFIYGNGAPKSDDRFDDDRRCRSVQLASVTTGGGRMIGVRGLSRSLHDFESSPSPDSTAAGLLCVYALPGVKVIATPFMQ